MCHLRLSCGRLWGKGDKQNSDCYPLFADLEWDFEIGGMRSGSEQKGQIEFLALEHEDQSERI